MPFMAFLSAFQTEQILQYIQIGLTILCAIITIAFTIYKWYKKATEDGKITKEEVEELFKNLEEPAEEIKKSVDDINNVKKE